MEKYRKRPLGRWYSRLLIVMIGSLVVSELGGTQGILERLHTREFYIEYFSTLLIAVMVMELVHRFNKMLESRYPWHTALPNRLVTQVLACILLPSLVVFLLASLYFRFFGVSILDTNYIYYAFPFIVVLIIVLNLLYIGLPYFIFALRGGFGDHGRVEQKKPLGYRDEIWVKDGASSVVLEVSRIGCIFIVEHTVIVRTVDKKNLVSDQSLDEIEQLLDGRHFFRINRQVIASRQACKSFRNLDYGKIYVAVEPGPPTGTVVSQRKASAFREWIESQVFT